MRKFSITMFVMVLYITSVSIGAFAEDTKKPQKSISYYGWAVAFLAGGLTQFWLANDYQNQYGDPNKYDQTQTKDRVNSYKMLGTGFLIGSSIFLVLGMQEANEEREKEKALSLSLKQKDGDILLVAQYRF